MLSIDQVLSGRLLLKWRIISPGAIAFGQHFKRTVHVHIHLIIEHL